ncbi:MAG: tetratricopeptide repeat protein [Pseudomonadota bacterium]
MRRRAVVGPRLRRLLVLVFVLFAVLVVNSVFLVSVTTYEWFTDAEIQGLFYQWMFLGHLALGLLILLPAVVYGVLHQRNARSHRNRRAVRAGYALFALVLVLLVTGLLLTRGFTWIELKDPGARSVAYWLHTIAPLLVAWLFVLHRLAGPPLRWSHGWSVGSLAFILSAAAIGAHQWQSNNPGEPNPDIFTPSLARSLDGQHIDSELLMMDDYCEGCHADSHASWAQSMHRFSSFNNPAYRFSVKQTRAALQRRDGKHEGVRFCAGCHDPVPLFSGTLDQPGFDLGDHPSAEAGITCTVCHSISGIDSNRGNADYTLSAPQHYPFARSESPVLRWVNETLVKANPEFHKRTFLKPLHSSAEFCGSCHKVNLPESLNDYRWLRGQNHYDSFLLSGVSGHGIQSFYYPKHAEKNCNGCHMTPVRSSDFGARPLAPLSEPAIHDHQFAAANTGVPFLLGHDGESWQRSANMLRDSLSVDIFGIREEGRLDGRLHAPLAESDLQLEAGKTYLLEVVLRTRTLGHHFTQGTADSNQIWLAVEVRSDDETLGRSGALRERDGSVDPWAHFVNSYVIDRDGRRIDRRNPEDIYTALYNHQIPPGAADVVHYRVQIPETVRGPVSISARLAYRKFDNAYLQHIQADEFQRNDLPIVEIASSELTLNAGSRVGIDDTAPLWQRWNDYGIGLLRREQFRQAEAAFSRVEALGVGDGPLNLARVYLAEGRLEEAASALQRASAAPSPAAPWSVSYFTARLNLQNGYFDAAIAGFRDLVDTRFQDARRRGFDFSKDYRLLNDLALATAQRARLERRNPERADEYLRDARDWYEKTLALDPENATAHYGLAQVHERLGDASAAARHRGLHARYKVDDSAKDRAVKLARQRDPAADHAANRIVIYDLQRSVDAG